MRFRSLRLAPFGAFVDRTLRFDGERGLHVVFGPNGAGKSTTLRALRAALHGLGREDFAVGREPRDIRLGAELERADGATLAFTRRTSRKQPLYDAKDESPLAEELLDPFLGGLTREEFETLFGLDLETMVSGGEELLRGEGEIGRALFGAALGGQLLASVERRLDGHLSELWARQSTKARINQLRKRHDELVRARNDATLRPTRFVEERKELDRLQGEHDEVRAEVRALAEQASGLRRQAAGLRVLAELEAKEAARAALGDDAPLEPELRTRVLGWREEREQQARQRDDLAKRLREIEAERVQRAAEAAVFTDDAARRIQALLGRRQGMNDALLELEEAREARDRARGVRAQASSQAGLAEADSPAPEGDLVPAAEAHRERLQAAEAQIVPADRERRAAEAQLASLREDLDGIEARIGTELARQFEQVAPFRGTAVELAALAVPEASRVEALAAEQRELEVALLGKRQARDEAEVQRERAQAALEQLGRAGGLPPTEAEVQAARTERDAAFSALLEAGAGGSEPGAAEAVRVHAAMVRADELADRRADDLERAAARASATSQETAAAAARDAADAGAEELEEALKELAARHAALWDALRAEPLPPEEMLRWLERRARLLDEAEGLRRGARDAVRAAEEDLKGRAAAHGAALAAAEGARQAWVGWAKEHGFDADAGPGAALERLRARREVDLAAGEERRAAARVEQLEGLVETFEAEARGLSEECAVVPAGPEEAALPERLAFALASAHQRRAQAVVLLRASEKTAEELRARQAEASRAHGEVQASLAEAAGGEGLVDELLERAGLSGRLAELDGEIAALARRVLDEGGAGRDELGALCGDGETCEAAAGRLGGEAEAVGARRDEAEARALEQAARLGELRARASHDGSAAAAELEAERLQVVAEMEEAAQAYLVARVARQLLDREVERYRTTTQGPILERAQELFEMLTLGAYQRLVAAQNDRGKDEMVARRPDGTTVAVGGMSSGTRDQLYLALRIASVEHKLSEDAEPMPFIADDLFVNFDDARTEAALRVLASLAERTQVIVFSHHESVVTTCGRLAEEGMPVEVVRLIDEATREATREAPKG